MAIDWRRQRAKVALTITMSTILLLISRGLFFLHSLITAWRVCDKLENEYYLIVGVVLLFAAIEMYWVLVKRKAREWTWLSVHVLLYLITVVPGIWLLRLEQVNDYRTELNNKAACNKTLVNMALGINCNETMEDTLETLSTRFNITIPLQLSESTWLEILPETIIFNLIITRWIAPFGRASHRKLSEQLFVYVGLGSDIVELFDLYESNFVITNDVLTYWILVAWTLSLTQFVLPLTGAIKPSHTSKGKPPRACRDCMGKEQWTIVAVVMLQDGPFLAIRLYIMTELGQANYGMGFFVVKNILVICLQIYRLIVLAYCVDKKTGLSLRRKRISQMGSSSTERSNSSTSKGEKGQAVVDTSGVEVLDVDEEEVKEDEEGEEEDEDEDETESGDDDIENQKSAPEKTGYSNDAFSGDTEA